MKYIVASLCLMSLSSAAIAQEQCSTVAQCAQLAMEAAYQAKLALQIATPKGAVLAFDSDKCPEGWTDFGQASGRTIVGADPSNPMFNLGKIGGRVDIPMDGQHNHAVQGRRNELNGRFGNDNGDDDWSTVANGAHNHGGDNMPPYIALKLCKRQ